MFPLVKEPSIVATPEPRPETPPIGSPLQFVRVPLAGVPRIGLLEFVMVVPIESLKVVIWFASVPPVTLTTILDTTRPESAMILPPTPGNHARLPGVAEPGLETILSAARVFVGPVI